MGTWRLHSFCWEAKADKDKAEIDGTTPLIFAAQNGHLELARLLLEAKADRPGHKRWRHPIVQRSSEKTFRGCTPVVGCEG